MTEEERNPASTNPSPEPEPVKPGEDAEVRPEVMKMLKESIQRHSDLLKRLANIDKRDDAK